MLPRIRSFLKRTKSSNSTSKISSISTAETDSEPLPPLPHTISTPTLHHQHPSSTSETAITTPIVVATSPEKTTRHLLPSPFPADSKPISIPDQPIASDTTDTGTSLGSLPTNRSPSVSTLASSSQKKHISVQEDDISLESSPHQPWLSPASVLPTRNKSSPASPASLPGSSSTSSLQPKNDLKIMQRKIWVRRPGASATLVTVNDDDLVDTVRDMILHKYANSLGKSIDSPDITLKIVSREQANKNIPVERTLGPEEPIGRTLDLYYAGGQSIEEALIIDIPQKRTPKPSPRVSNFQPMPYPYYVEDQYRPSEAGRDYFPPVGVHSPHVGSHPQHPPSINGAHIPHSMSILAASGQGAPLPSPGAHSTRRRPKYVRQHTSSPTIMHSHQPNSNELKQPPPTSMNPPAALPTPPPQSEHRPSINPSHRATSPHSGRPKRKNKGQGQPQNNKNINEHSRPSLKTSTGLLDGNVPPINVLIVEDNVINLRLLEQFMRKLKLRWSTAMNGQEAVNTWRTGGFHLVLMDIQLPVMSGLEATKEIRRLESVNGIGLGLVGSQDAREKRNGNREINEKDKLGDMSLFKSPVIIVALTASSLQSDRHEALAVGCNDFLTKPVGYPWMLRKVTEWGCMQALIDFDGWRKWKAYAEEEERSMTPEQKKAKEKEDRLKRKAELTKMFMRPPPTTGAGAGTANSGSTAGTSNSTSTSTTTGTNSTADKGKETSGTANTNGKAKEINTSANISKSEKETRSPINGTHGPPKTQTSRGIRAGSGGATGPSLTTHEEEEEDDDGEDGDE